MSRKRAEWKIKKETWRLGERTLLVGVVNVTPDSVLGRYDDPDRAYVRAMELADQGADIVELGAESMRQGSSRVSEAEELRRLVPVLKRLRGKLNVPICVETYKGAVAEKALSLGAAIIKDSTALTIDPGLAKVVAQYDAGFLIQHMRGTPETWAKLGSMKNPTGTVLEDVSAAISRATRGGVLRESIALDPGLGMGKRKEQNTEILANLDQLNSLRVALQVSPSDKPFDSTPAVEPSTSTTVAAAVMAVLRGAHLIRVHDIAAVRPAVLIADAALRGFQAGEPAPAPAPGPNKGKAPRPGETTPASKPGSNRVKVPLRSSR